MPFCIPLPISFKTCGIHDKYMILFVKIINKGICIHDEALGNSESGVIDEHVSTKSYLVHFLWKTVSA